MTHQNDYLRRSIIIAAHPDDEILWFSSIIEKVDGIVLCFLDVDSNPKWSAGRRRSLSSYPLPNLSCLGITESEVFDGANWPAPIASGYGLEIVNRKGSVTRYKNNFGTLRTLLKEKLTGVDNVYTHNPWGEYGHEEHVQVYRAVKDLQATMPFNLWYTNYFSNKSACYMNGYIGKSQMTHHRLPTNRPVASTIMDLYKQHQCWTWYDDYAWPDQECFILEQKSPAPNKTFGKTLDLNFIKIWTPQKKRRGPSAMINRSLRSIAGKLR